MIKSGLDYLGSLEKRNLDVFVSATMLGASAPVIGLISIGVVIDTKSFNPIFKQTRVGENDSHIEIYKLRSLPKAGETKDIKTYGAFDPRATKFGRFIRRSSLDELPQLWNVAHGDMTMVGPRPAVDCDLERYRQAES